MSNNKILENCPICDSKVESYNVDEDILKFLKMLRKDNVLDEWLKVCKVHLDIIRHGAPTAAVMTKVISTVRTEIKKSASSELGEVADELPIKIQEVLQDKIPDTEQLENLVKVLPELTLAIHELLIKQEVPQIKGEEGEQELASELSSYFPEDEVDRLGKSGETDIILRPRLHGAFIGYEVMVESKKNKTWRRSYLDQVRRHMSDRGCNYAILAVHKMPEGGNMYMTELLSEGTIFVTVRECCKMVYGAIRAIILSEYTLGRRAANLQLALADSRIQDAIRKAFNLVENVETIRKKVRRIISNADDIIKESDIIERKLQACLIELQERIQSALADSCLDNLVVAETSRSTAPSI